MCINIHILIHLTKKKKKQETKQNKPVMLESVYNGFEERNKNKTDTHTHTRLHTHLVKHFLHSHI